MRSLLLASSLALAGCQSPPAGARPSGDAQAKQCTEFGQTCEYAPNKLGSCVRRENCTTDCLVCQSQH
ncbi:MAG TPA: hypothetical protein VIF09_20970 [Polyangiaceae bacterium]